MGEHALSVAAIDAALASARAGKLLFSEALTVRARAFVGRAAEPASGSDGSSASLHWSAATGRQRLLDVMGRMRGTEAALKRLLLDGDEPAAYR